MLMFADRKEVWNWLADKPREWANVLALRAALRVLPIVNPTSSVADRVSSPQYLNQFRTTFIAWATRRWNVPTLTIIVPSLADKRAGDAAVGAASAALHAAARLARGDAVEFATDAISLSLDSARAASEIVPDASIMGQEIGADAEILLAEGMNESADKITRRLALRGLWNNGTPPWFSNALDNHAQRLHALDQNYDFWIDWYRQRIIGGPAAFGLNDLYDEAIMRRIMEKNDRFWNRSPMLVNEEILAWFTDATKRRGDYSATVTDVREKAAEVASPYVEMREGKVHAGPNPVLDVADVREDRVDLPASLRGIIDTILETIPDNSPPVVKSCLQRYSSHLTIRGWSPIVGLIEAYASAIESEFHSTEFDLWGAGRTDLFNSFFQQHRLLMRRFPRGIEREKFYSATPVDEFKASGSALTDPIRDASDAFEQISEEKLTTEDFDRILADQLQQSIDLASLPPMSPTTSGQQVTAKRRFVLGTIGFYERAIHVLSSMATIIASPILRSVIDILRRVIERLLAFLG